MPINQTEIASLVRTSTLVTSESGRVAGPRCPVCRKTVNLNDIHPTSDRIPADGQYVAFHTGCANGEDCVGGADLSDADIDDSRAWIKLS